MANPEPFPSGSFCWVDLATSDPAAALSFYGALFGWQATGPSADRLPYWMLSKDGRQVGGLFALAPETPRDGASAPRWQSYIAVADADAAAARAVELGGRVLMPPTAAGDAGRMVYVQDPGGAMVALWQARTRPGAQLVNALGAPCWHELHSRDLDATLAFYEGLCGWRHRVSGSVPGGEYELFVDSAGRPCAGIMPSGSGWAAQCGSVVPHWAVYFGVDDCDATVAQAHDLGARLASPVTDLPRIGRFAGLTDPQGATFWVIRFAGEHA
jgi:predicted enzyme related to lactoylglutathione lyase